MKLFCVFIAALFFNTLQAQDYGISGIVRDSQTKVALAGASITIFKQGAVSGGICNREGRFSINCQGRPDSVKFSMIGYHSKLYGGSNLPHGDSVTVEVEPSAISLHEVVVRQVKVMDVIRLAAQKMPSFTPSTDFESMAFYREIIRDSTQYYSVAEAIFRAQFAVQKKSFKLGLEKGRSKQDVAYTRLFEDFHPGGGPEDAVGQSFATSQPDFLTEGKFKNYTYKLDSTILRDNDLIYVISLDQQPDVKEALEKGTVYIDANDFSVWKYEVANSPRGAAYIRSLRGMDKIFAQLLHVDLAIKGWSRTATYTKIGDKLFLAYAKMGYTIDYKQPKKALDLHLIIKSELMVTDFQRPVIHEINKDEEWKRKKLATNLPADFDPRFWGSSTILDPTAEVKNIIGSISKKNKDGAFSAPLDGWGYFNRGFFVSYKNGDSITLVPVAKCSWEDDKTGGMIYKALKGDFVIEAKLSVKKRGNTTQEPDNGFQEAGIIIRQPEGSEEENFIFSMGTGGSDAPKYFLKRTVAGKTKGTVTKTSSLTGWVKLEKRGKLITAYQRLNDTQPWIKVDEYKSHWAETDLQVGFSVMARFAGNGPKQRPDMQAIFSKVKVGNL